MIRDLKELPPYEAAGYLIFAAYFECVGRLSEAAPPRRPRAAKTLRETPGYRRAFREVRLVYRAELRRRRDLGVGS